MIVLDANILIRAVMGRRVRELLEQYASPQLQFCAPDAAYLDAEKYLPPLLRKRGKPAADVSGALKYFAASRQADRPGNLRCLRG